MDILDLLFRGAIAGATITGCSLYFKAKAGWVRQCHLTMGALATILCFVTFFEKWS